MTSVWGFRDWYYSVLIQAVFMSSQIKLHSIFLCSYLASGDSYNSLRNRFRLGLSTVHYIIKETCDAIWEELVDEHMPIPKLQDWERIAKRFEKRWNFPNCVGALDGKHVRIQAPNFSGSTWFNYKGHFSMVLMALVDANYKFIYVDIGDYGHKADGTVFRNSLFGQKFMDKTLGIPPETEVKDFENRGPLPHHIVADEAFPLRPDLMRPYPRGTGPRLSREEQIFNYRLSRARRIVENAFGILVQRWRIFSKVINLFPENVERLIKACLILHNYLRGNRDVKAMEEDLNPQRIPYNTPEAALQPIPRQGLNYAREAKETREAWKDYFNSPAGAVPWQDRSVDY